MYKAITTKYHPATDTRGSRVSAKDMDGNRVSISYPYALSGEAAAPDLLDVLKDLTALYESSPGRDPSFVEKARAAIAKATGKTP